MLAEAFPVQPDLSRMAYALAFEPNVSAAEKMREITTLPAIQSESWISLPTARRHYREDLSRAFALQRRKHP